MSTKKLHSTLDDTDKRLWPLSDLDQALLYVARQCSSFDASSISGLPSLDNNNDIAAWLDVVCDRIGVKAEPLVVQYGNVDDLLRKNWPALYVFNDGETSRACIVIRAGKNHLAFLGTDLKIHKGTISWLRSHYCQSIEKDQFDKVDEILQYTSIKEKKRNKTRYILVRQRIGDTWLGDCWLLQLPMNTGFSKHMSQLFLFWRVGSLLLLHFFYYVLWIVSWWLIGKSVFAGHVESTWIVAWGFLLLTMIPLRMTLRWLQGTISVRLGCLLKQKLCFGALQLDPDDIRHQGVGQLLGRVIEAEQLETLSVQGGFVGLLAFVELIMALFVLGSGINGGAMICLLCVWLLLAFYVCWKYYMRRKNWTNTRLDLTHKLVERLIGHRTRRLQESRTRRHEEEDAELAEYLSVSQKVDRQAALLFAMIPRGWIAVSLLVLAPSLISMQVSAASLAVSIGGMVLAFRALQKLVISMNNMSGAAIAWSYVSDILSAAHQRTETSLVNTNSKRFENDNIEHVLQVKGLDFFHKNSNRKILNSNTLTLYRQDRVLLQGPSGGGKSTLVSILTGLRHPTSGLMLFRGLDEKTWGAKKWRKHIVSAAQFHENRVLTGSFAFNLLMGREWPPRQADLLEAEELCRALGLERLLQEMPAGLMQMVGDTGWQLSHGEKSRLYIARTLLQNAPVVIFDESFAALDPETLLRVYNYVDEHVDTLIVVAHP